MRDVATEWGVYVVVALIMAAIALGSRWLANRLHRWMPRTLAEAVVGVPLIVGSAYWYVS